MRFLLKFFIFLLIIIVLIVSALYLARGFILNKIKLLLVEKIEESTPLGIRIEKIGYIPLKGIGIDGLSIFSNKLYTEKLLELPNLYVKFPLVKLIKQKRFLPTITVKNLRLKNNLVICGTIGLSMNLSKPISDTRDLLAGLQTVSLSNCLISYNNVKVENLKGAIHITPESIKTRGFSLAFDKKEYAIDLIITDPLETPSLDMKVNAQDFSFTSQINKEADVFKIPKIKGHFFHSSFEFMGEFENIDDPFLSLYGDIEFDTRDIAPLIRPEYRKNLEILDPKGKITNAVYFKGKLKNQDTWEIGVKSSTDSLKIHNFKIPDIAMDTRIKEGVLTVPILKAFPYNGAIASTMTFDFKDPYMPYMVKCKLSGIDVREVLKETELRDRDIHGLLFLEAALQGEAKNLDSLEGAVTVFIKDANLGPVPLLTPLLGSIYGSIQGMMPGLKRVEITKATGDFTIANRKISTDNVLLWGEVVSVQARGYMDFDTNLNFEVENQFQEPEKAESEDWQSDLQQMIAQFGKLMSKAYLTGTLKKPKWKFQYLGGINKMFEGGLDKVIKDIFE